MLNGCRHGDEGIFMHEGIAISPPTSLPKVTINFNVLGIGRIKHDLGNLMKRPQSLAHWRSRRCFEQGGTSVCDEALSRHKQ